MTILKENTETSGELTHEINLFQAQYTNYLVVRDRLSNICNRLGSYPEDVAEVGKNSEPPHGIIGALRSHRDSMDSIYDEITSYLSAIERAL